MVQYTQFLENAKKYNSTAEHLLTETFPVVKDPKMLISVLNNVFMAFQSIIQYYLYRDLALGKIPEFDTDFKNMLDLFRARSERRYSIKPDYLKAIDEVYNIIKQRKNAPMEFSRHEMFIICTNDYDMKSISTANLRDYIGKAKLFIDEISSQIVKNA